MDSERTGAAHIRGISGCLDISFLPDIFRTVPDIRFIYTRMRTFLFRHSGTGGNNTSSGLAANGSCCGTGFLRNFSFTLNNMADIPECSADTDTLSGIFLRQPVHSGQSDKINLNGE